jgi:hypothetical protein
VIIYVEHLGARIVDSIWQARKEDTGSDGLILLLMQLLKRGKLQYDRQLGG